MSMTKFKMRRSGSFQANWVSNENVCGVDPSMRPVYTFECEMETTNKLDAQGFIVDNNEVVRYFTDKYSRSAPVEAKSCERIARAAVSYFLRLLDEHGQTPLRVAVTVSAMTQAALTCEWTEDSTEQDRSTAKALADRYLKDMAATLKANVEKEKHERAEATITTE